MIFSLLFKFFFYKWFVFAFEVDHQPHSWARWLLGTDFQFEGYVFLDHNFQMIVIIYKLSKVQEDPLISS